MGCPLVTKRVGTAPLGWGGGGPTRDRDPRPGLTEYWGGERMQPRSRRSGYERTWESRRITPVSRGFGHPETRATRLGSSAEPPGYEGLSRADHSWACRPVRRDLKSIWHWRCTFLIVRLLVDHHSGQRGFLGRTTTPPWLDGGAERPPPTFFVLASSAFCACPRGNPRNVAGGPFQHMRASPSGGRSRL